MYSMDITFVTSATVSDVVGLALYKYVVKGRKPRPKNDVKSYYLHATEEDGELDLDIPILDDKEAMSDYGFTHLALVEKHYRGTRSPVVAPAVPSKNSVTVTILIPNNGYSVVQVENGDVKIRTILQKLIKKRGLKKNISEFHLEKPNEEGRPVDLEVSLNSTGSLVFNLVGMDRSPSPDPMPSLIYESYPVMMLHYLTSTEVSLGIHGQKIEIDPLAQSKSQMFLTRAKPMSLDVEDVAECEIIARKPGRCVFRIYYKKMEEFKHYEFETDPEKAEEIVLKIHNILQCLFTTVPEEFSLLRNKRKLK